jgi:hypothetical protein
MAGFPKAKLGKNGKMRKTGESPVLQPRAGIPLDKNLIKQAIIKYHGNLSRVADSLGTHRNVVRSHCDRDSDLKATLENARERLIDELEESVFERAVHSQDSSLQMFVLKTQGRHRGWEQSEMQDTAKDIAKAAFEFITNKSKNPAES